MFAGRLQHCDCKALMFRYNTMVCLLQRGADVNLRDVDGNTALTMAMKGKHDG